MGDTIAVTDALGRISTMVYDTHIGRLTSATDPKLQTMTLGYDGEDRLLQTTYQDGSVTKNLIDADGNVTETVDSAGATLFTYDGDNRPSQQTYPDGTVVSYSYDAAGRLQTKSEPGLPTTTYGYDSGGRLKTVSNSLLGQFAYSYDAASRLTALGYPIGVTTSYSLDNDNRVTGIVLPHGRMSPARGCCLTRYLTATTSYRPYQVGEDGPVSAPRRGRAPAPDTGSPQPKRGSRGWPLGPAERDRGRALDGRSRGRGGRLGAYDPVWPTAHVRGGSTHALAGGGKGAFDSRHAGFL